ncbi:MAG: DUF86 domain-containing protein [Hormoscilla sp. SP5CHS1]|nr:DUF86 domain-containing protein [Hormoscilla sp. SP12CHS1]MBC6454737.1 DUF86 domain-containing protein [Hormoscilla sp. SP5CHS1]
MTQIGVLYQIMIIGESARAMSPPLRAQNPKIPWSLMVGMRNILVYQHFEVDINNVWSGSREKFARPQGQDRVNFAGVGVNH